MNSHRKNHSKQFPPLSHQTGRSRGTGRIDWGSSVQSHPEVTNNRANWAFLLPSWGCLRGFPTGWWLLMLLLPPWKKNTKVIRFSEHPTTGQRPTPPAWRSRRDLFYRNRRNQGSQNSFFHTMKMIPACFFADLFFFGGGIRLGYSSQTHLKNKNSDESHGTMCKTLEFVPFFRLWAIPG